MKLCCKRRFNKIKGKDKGLIIFICNACNTTNLKKEGKWTKWYEEVKEEEI